MFEEQVNVLRLLQGIGDGLLADIAAEDFCKQPLPAMNHPAWILGHLTFATDRHATFVGAEQQHADWDGLFGKGSTPEADLGKYPSKEELIAAWHGSNNRIITGVQAASPETLAAPNEHVRPEALPTLGDFLTFSMVGHTSTHLGQLSAWRRASGFEPLF